jgi:hypothetical protein
MGRLLQSIVRPLNDGAIDDLKFFRCVFGQHLCEGCSEIGASVGSGGIGAKKIGDIDSLEFEISDVLGKVFGSALQLLVLVRGTEWGRER